MKGEGSKRSLLRKTNLAAFNFCLQLLINNAKFRQKTDT